VGNPGKLKQKPQELWYQASPNRFQASPHSKARLGLFIGFLRQGKETAEVSLVLRIFQLSVTEIALDVKQLVLSLLLSLMKILREPLVPCRFMDLDGSS
jgi:hypothetical protein